jgi:hypothetical protein
MDEETEVKISFDLDQFDANDFDAGWHEDIQEGKIKAIRQMVENYAVVEGLPAGMNLTGYLRSLKLIELIELGTQLTAIINEKQDPVKNGKNSKGGSPNTSSPRRGSRR